MIEDDDAISEDTDLKYILEIGKRHPIQDATIDEVTAELVDEGRTSLMLKQFISFIVAIEGRNNTTKYLIDASEYWSSVEGGFEDDGKMKNKLYESSQLTDEALIRCLNMRSEIMVRYVIKRANALFLDIMISQHFLSDYVNLIMEREAMEILKIL